MSQPTKTDVSVSSKNDGTPAEAEEKNHNEDAESSFSWALVFWVLMIVAALVLGIIYFIVKVGDNDCSHGTALPGDVTAPDNIDFGETLAVIWGYIPYAVGLACAAYLFWARTMWPVLLLLLAACIVVVNEGFFKRVIAQDRPSESCLHSKGMPSSHATLAIGYWTWFHLEVLLKPQLTTTSVWTLKSKMVVLLSVYVLFLPVPFTRVALHDHSWAQVGVGALIGACVAVGWFFLCSKVLYKHLDRFSDILSKCPCCWGRGLFYDFTNNFYPPPDEHLQTQSQIARRLALAGSAPLANEQDEELAGVALHSLASGPVPAA